MTESAEIWRCIYPGSCPTDRRILDVLNAVAQKDGSRFYLDTVESMSNDGIIHDAEHHQGLARSHILSDGSIAWFLSHAETDSGGSLSWYRYAGPTDGEHILQTVYNATKRIRKTLALHWDEAEFRQMLASTDWAQLHAAAPHTRSMTGRAPTPVAQLLASVQEHPWAIGAAAMLGMMGRGGTGGTPQRLWTQRWAALLRARN